MYMLVFRSSRWATSLQCYMRLGYAMCEYDHAACPDSAVRGDVGPLPHHAVADKLLFSPCLRPHSTRGCCSLPVRLTLVSFTVVELYLLYVSV